MNKYKFLKEMFTRHYVAERNIIGFKKELDEAVTKNDVNGIKHYSHMEGVASGEVEILERLIKLYIE